MKLQVILSRWKVYRNAVAFALALCRCSHDSSQQGPQPAWARSLLRHHLGRARAQSRAC